MDKPQRGGKREGSGRPKTKPTVILTFRVPADKAVVLKEKILKVIAKEKGPSWK